MIGLLAMLVLLCALAWALAAVAAQWLSRYSFEALPPKRRLHRFTLVALLPWLLPASWAAALAGVALGKRAGWIDDHCRIHGDRHPHLCFEHFPAIQIEPLAGAALLMVLAAVTMVVVRHAWVALARRARLAALLRLVPSNGLVRKIDDERPLAMVARPLRPVLLVSRGLFDGLDARERRIVIAHEAAHLRGRDLIKSSLFECLLALHPPASAARLRAHWRQAIEERADDRVARRFGGADTAQALLKVVRRQQLPAPIGLAAGGADIVRRVERLLAADEPEVFSRDWSTVALGLSLLVSAAWLAGAHHAIETVLGVILGV